MASITSLQHTGETRETINKMESESDVSEHFQCSLHHAASTLTSLKSFQINGVLCDVYLQSNDGVPFPVHKVILGSCSSTFLSIFCQSTETVTPPRIHMDANVKVVSAFVDYLYSGYVSLAPTDEHFHDLKKLAETYSVSKLLSKIENHTQSVQSSSTMEECQKGHFPITNTNLNDSEVQNFPKEDFLGGFNLMPKTVAKEEVKTPRKIRTRFLRAKSTPHPDFVHIDSINIDSPDYEETNDIKIAQEGMGVIVNKNIKKTKTVKGMLEQLRKPSKSDRPSNVSSRASVKELLRAKRKEKEKVVLNVETVIEQIRRSPNAKTVKEDSRQSKASRTVAPSMNSKKTVREILDEQRNKGIENKTFHNIDFDCKDLDHCNKRARYLHRKQKVGKTALVSCVGQQSDVVSQEPVLIKPDPEDLEMDSSSAQDSVKLEPRSGLELGGVWSVTLPTCRNETDVHIKDEPT